MKFYNTIFATPIIELNIKINNKKIINYIKKIQKYSSGRVVSNEGGWQSEDLNPNLDILKPLTKHIIEGSIEFAKNCKFKPGKYSVSNLWANINNYKDSNESHVHQFCMLSGVYYLKAPKNSGNLVLKHPSACLEYDWNKTKMIEHMEYNSALYNFVPKEGQLLLFPSWVEHFVKPNLNKTQERISIAFNIGVL